MRNSYYIYSDFRDPLKPWVVAVENPEGGFTEFRYSHLYLDRVLAKGVSDYNVMWYKSRYKFFVENAELFVDAMGVAHIRAAPVVDPIDPERTSGAV